MYRANKAEPMPKASGNVVEHHTYSPRLSQYFVSKRDPATTRCSQHVARDRPSAAFMPVLHKRNYVLEYVLFAGAWHSGRPRSVAKV